MIETLSDHYFNLINSDILKTKTIDIKRSSIEDRIEVEDRSRLRSFEVDPLYELTQTHDNECLDGYNFAWSAELLNRFVRI